MTVQPLVEMSGKLENKKKTPNRLKKVYDDNNDVTNFYLQQ